MKRGHFCWPWSLVTQLNIDAGPSKRTGKKSKLVQTWDKILMQVSNRQKFDQQAHISSCNIAHVFVADNKCESLAWSNCEIWFNFNASGWFICFRFESDSNRIGITPLSGVETRRPATTGIFCAFPNWYRCNFEVWERFFFEKNTLSSSYFLVFPGFEIF